MNNTGLGPLSDGGRAVVIGGGPGGVAAAISLKQGARALGYDVSVTIVEGKQFVGEQHHNQCSGVLSPPVIDLIETRLGVPFNRHLDRGLITGYVLHTTRRSIFLEGRADPSIAVRRVHFDAFMLQAARECGVEVLLARVTDLEFHDNRVVVFTDSHPLEAEVVVGAFGLDEGTANIFQRAVGYRSPPALSSIVTKYHPGEEGMVKFGQNIHAFLPASPRIEFGAVTPKGNHLTINIAGATVDSALMDVFLAEPAVRQVLPCFENACYFDPNDLRYFKGRFPCGLGRNYRGNRFVLVGDAAGLVRAFKGKGITSAIQSGLRAADVILKQGISETAFRAYDAANRDILEDLPYGRAMRLLTILASRYGLMDIVIQTAQENESLRQALFDAVSAHRTYHEVIQESFSPKTAYAIMKTFLKMAASKPVSRR